MTLPVNHDSDVIGWEVLLAEFQLSFFTCFSEKNLTVSHQVESLAVGVTLEVFCLGLVLYTNWSFEWTVDEFSNIVLVFARLDHYVLN